MNTDDNNPSNKTCDFSLSSKNVGYSLKDTVEIRTALASVNGINRYFVYTGCGQIVCLTNQKWLSSMKSIYGKPVVERPQYMNLERALRNVYVCDFPAYTGKPNVLKGLESIKLGDQKATEKKKVKRRVKHWQSISSLEGAESFKVYENGCQARFASA